MHSSIIKTIGIFMSTRAGTPRRFSQSKLPCHGSISGVKSAAIYAPDILRQASGRSRPRAARPTGIEMTEKEVSRTIRSLYGSILISAAAQFHHRPEVVAGIMCRESEGGLSRHLDRAGPAGRGDSGHGHGLMQIDNRSFPEFCAGDDWPDPDKNVAFAARVLRNKRRFLASRLLGHLLTHDDLERAAIA